MLRIDPVNPILKPGSADPISGNGQYRIPTTNPFQGAGQVPEIYAYGFRNPYRFSFDTANGQLIVADVGQNTVEEIDRITLGGNYGWAVKEGDFLFNRTTGPGGAAGTVGVRSPGIPAGLIDPISGPSGTLEYDHDDGISITGGFVYRGTAIPELIGKYVFGDLALQGTPIRANGRLFYADLGNGEIKEFLSPDFTAEGFLPDGLTVHGFGEDANGELYALVTNTPPNGTGGIVYAITASPVDVTWTGGAGTTWSNATGSGNWKKTSDSTPADYGNGAAVIFNDSATGSLTASINAADVSPASVVFNNSTKAYVVNGTRGIAGSATVLKQGTAKVTISSVNSYSGVTTLETTGGTLQFNKATAWTPVTNLGGANIKAGKMIFDYTGESSPAATIGALLKTSYHSGSATHFDTGKFQSTTADANHGLGWKDIAGSSQVLVAYTLYGDATVNGAVDISDLSALGQNWNGSGKVWAQADFTYDGKVDISDLSALGQHWNQSIAGFSGAEGGGLVPEPNTLALLATGLLAYGWRRRK
jgi:hypothetical protein